MNQRRTLILVVAIAIGALASFLVWNYVNGIEDEANSNAEQVPVFVVSETISRGDSGLESQAKIVRTNIPRRFKPANAITNPEDISNKVAVSDLVANQVVVSDLFVDASDPRARQSFAERLAKIQNEDQVALTISLDEVRGVNGLIEPGDFVNIMVTQVQQFNEAGEVEGVPANVDPKEVMFGRQARYLYQKVEVLAVDQEAIPQAGASASGGEEAAAPVNANRGLITLILPTAAAQYVASVPPEYIYLVLVGRDYQPEPLTQIDINAPLPGEDENQLTPYGPEGSDSGE